MADIITKTINQADEAADVLDTDYMLIQRGDAPAQKVRVQAHREAIADHIAEEFPESHLAIATAAAEAAAADAAAAAADRAVAVNAADAAVRAGAAQGSYPNSAATVVPRGVTSATLTAPGTGYTNGTDYVGTFTGGGGTLARFLFDVVGNAVTNIHGIEPGYGYTGNPTGGDFSAAGAGTGATLTAVTSHLVASGKFYWAASADGATERMYQNAAGVATAVNPAVVRPYAGLVMGVANASNANLFNFVADAGFSVTGVGQVFRAIAQSPNGSDWKMAIPGVFGGAQVSVVLPNGDIAPANCTKTNYPFSVTPAVIGGVNRLVLVFPTYIARAQVIRLEWMGPLAYTNGSGAISAGQTIVGATSGVSDVVISVPDAEATGTGSPAAWDGSRAGTLYVKKASAFIAGEDLTVGGVVKAKAGGPVGNPPTMRARIADPGQVYPADFIGPLWSLRPPVAKAYGGPGLKLYASDGVTVLAERTLRLSDDTVSPPDAGSWQAGDLVTVTVNATSLQWNMATAPDTSTAKLTELIGSEADLPPRIAPILYRRVSRRRIEVSAAAVAYDDASKRMNQDVHRTVLGDLGEGMSLIPELQNPHAWSVQSDVLEAATARLHYGDLLTDDMGAGVFDQLQPSIAEPVFQIGPLGAGVDDVFASGPHAGKEKFELIGNGHGLRRMVSCVHSIEAQAGGNGAWGWTTIPDTVGLRKRGRQLTSVLTRLDFRKTDTGYECIGESAQTFHWSYQWAGMRIHERLKHGRSLAYTDYGPTAIPEAVTVTGETSGATAVVVVIPAAMITSGTIAAGTAAGRMNVRSASVTPFEAGEWLLVGGVRRAKAAGPVGEALAVNTAYGHMLLGTTVNRAKVNGLAEQITGYELPASDEIGAGKYVQPHGQGSRFQMRHANAEVSDWIYELIQMDADWNEAAMPMIPGGYAADQGIQSGFWVQDRAEGVRKGYNNIRTGGTSPVLWEGQYDLRAVRRFRRGAVV